MTLAFTPIASNPAWYPRIRRCHLKLLFGKMYVCLLDFCNIINQLAKVFLKLILLRGIFFLQARCSYPQFLFCYRFYSSLYCIFVITEGIKKLARKKIIEQKPICMHDDYIHQRNLHGFFTWVVTESNQVAKELICCL